MDTMALANLLMVMSMMEDEMTKPSDITQEAWEDAAHAMEKWRGPKNQYWNECQEDIAYAIMAAKEEERQACEDVVRDFIWDGHELAQATDIGTVQHHQAVDIHSAIRRRGEVPNG